MEVLKINNPNWLPAIAPRIADYVKIIKEEGLTYEGMYAYFAHATQFGGDKAEFVVVFDENEEPCAFASWYVMGLPYTGVVHFDHVYSWHRSNKPMRMLADEYLQFAKRSRSTIGGAFVHNERVMDIFKKHCERLGYKITELPKTFITMTQKE